MDKDLAWLAGPGHKEALARRREIAGLALKARNSHSRGGAVSDSTADYLDELSRRTVCITLLAGSGSRWVRSLEAVRAVAPEAREEAWKARGRSFDPARPRGLFPVRDALREPEASRGESRGSGGGSIPIAAFALAAFRGLGRQIIVVRGWEREIDEEILGPLGIGPDRREFFTQEAPFGKPLGHGDAVWQCRALWKDADYVMTNFGGDASSRRTAASALLALDALGVSGLPVDLLMPAASIHGPAYPIVLDDEGLPRSFGHAKLQGKALSGGSGYTNVGLRLYRASALFEAVERFRGDFWVEGEGYAIPGNDPGGHEFALDNVDAALAAAGRARILAFARPEELTPAKSLEDLGAFEAAAASVVAEDTAAEDTAAEDTAAG
ncbi:MAG: hypothetical protein M0Z80_02465 [Treponema sp.]|nr:hypothetical protein [Treponema sp.]